MSIEVKTRWPVPIRMRSGKRIEWAGSPDQVEELKKQGGEIYRAGQELVGKDIKIRQ